MKLKDKIYLVALSLVAVLSATAVFTDSYKPRKRAKVYKDGKLLRIVNLSEITVPYTIDIDGKNILLAEKGKISMKWSDCPDKLCIKKGCNYPIVCLHNKLVVTVEG